MPRILTVDRKLFSWWRQVHRVLDERGEPLYEMTWRWGWPTRTWVVSRGGRPVAAMRRKLLAFAPTWIVEAAGARFLWRRKLLALRRRTQAIGGPFDGAELTGSLLGLSFRLERGGRLVARARERILTLRERHDVELLDDTPDGELLAALAMFNLLLQKEAEQEERAATGQ
ncbi:MAG TPA: hypothetical protein VF453_06140 [Burkholderiaceae bacterium]